MTIYRAKYLAKPLHISANMEHYKNLNRDSNITQFEIQNDSIHVKFRDGKTYVYTYLSAGAANIEKMKILASNGKGLNTYINDYVRKKYSNKY